MSLSARLRLELSWFSGLAWLRGRTARGDGVILQFERVRPRRLAKFQPQQSREVTPEFLDRTLTSLKRWKFDIVSIDEACRRAVTLARPGRFVSLTFDGGAKDLITSAYPVLAKHRVPFTVYVPTAFPDGLGQAWWLALEAVIAGQDRVSLMIDQKEFRYGIETTSDKHQLYRFLDGWLRGLPAPELAAAIKDLCLRHAVDLAALSRESFMDWQDLSRLAADPLVTIGSATVNYPVLSNLSPAAALREIKMGRAVAETAFNREVRHFAYPFGDRGSFQRQHLAMVAEAGFTSAVTTLPGVVKAEGRCNLHALPRLAWDGRIRSLRALRAMLTAAAPVR